MARPLTFGDLAQVVEHGSAIANHFPLINETALVQRFQEMIDDPKARSCFLGHVNRLADVVRVIKNAPVTPQG